MRNIYGKTNLLLIKFFKCSVGVKCYLLILKTRYSNLCCAPMWVNCIKTALKKLKVAYSCLNCLLIKHEAGIAYNPTSTFMLS